MTKLRVALMHIRRTPYQAMAAISLTSLTFFVITVFALLNIGVNKLLKFVETQPQVTAFFTNEATEDDIQKLKKQIQDTGFVKDIVYTSKEQALEIYKKQNQNNPLLLEMVTADILPASLEISTNSVDDLEEVAKILEKNQKVEEVVYQKDVVNTIKHWMRGIRIGSISLASIFLSTAIITIIIIIGIKISNRRQEIDILSLLGATPWYIKSPFILEGMIYGILGAIIGWGVTYTALLYATPNLVEFFKGIQLFPISNTIMVEILLSEVVFGMFIGWIASLIATRRYGK